MAEGSSTHTYTRLDFLNRACTRGLAINGIGIAIEGIEKEEESVLPEREKCREDAVNKIIQLIERDQEATSRKIEELEKENKAASSKIYELEKENEVASSKIDELEKENEDSSSKIYELEKENEAASSKIYELEKENEVALSKMDVLEKKKEAASSKIEGLEKEKKEAASKIVLLEKEKEDALSKISLLEKENEAALSKITLLERESTFSKQRFGKYKNAQLRKEEELRKKILDLKRQMREESEAAMSKVAMLEKEMETEEVRVYKQAIRALKQIQVEDKVHREKVKELEVTVQKLTKERNYWENIAKQLKAKESETAELVEARNETIRVLSELYDGDTDIGVKKFGVIDSYPIHAVCRQKFSRQVAEEKATELCSIWQTAVEDPKWDPFRTITSNGEVQSYMLLDKDDKKLQQLRNDWGYEAYLAVTTALIEMKEQQINSKTMTHQLWNYMEGRKATLKEAICLMEEKLEDAKIKDTAFVTVDELKPRGEGMNLLVKVLNANVVLDKTPDPPCFRRSSYTQITRVAECLVGDETGTIIFTARNEQVDLMKPGSILLIYGAKIQMHRSYMRLGVEHHAQIMVAEPTEIDVDEDDECNKSLVEYEVYERYR